MRVKQIKLKNFRNYTEQTIEIASGTNVFVGQNAQGKTNILEAIYLCTCARSHRTGKDNDLIKDGADFYQVEIQFESDKSAFEDKVIIEDKSVFVERLLISDKSAIDNPELNYTESKEKNMEQSLCLKKSLTEEIRIEYKKNPVIERNIYYCGFKQEKISSLIGLFHAVIFAPEDVMLIKEGPAGRRRFLDLLISQIKPLYFRNLQLYQQYLKQRNNLLKILRDMQLDKRMNSATYDPEIYNFNLLQLTIWTEHLAKISAQIISTRHKYVLQIEEFAIKALEKISEGKEKLKINYKTVAGIDPKLDTNQIYEGLMYRFERQQEDDIQRGSTGSGSHRDDLELIVDNNLLKERGSQGQQRSAVLALKLAELQIIENETNQKPVLLLDDVMSELDDKRRTHLLSAFEDNQVFITCTDLGQIYPEYKGKLSDKEELSDKKALSDNLSKQKDEVFEINSTEISDEQNLSNLNKPKNKLKNDIENNLNYSYINFFKVHEGTVKRQYLL
ncbi:MAG TPA: DNA replication/repair protein RecF [Clostridiaceae bacterium]|nr:DNA replication/repair protein RecF [Clostridiaceae bacterium]